MPPPPIACQRPSGSSARPHRVGVPRLRAERAVLRRHDQRHVVPQPEVRPLYPLGALGPMPHPALCGNVCPQAPGPGNFRLYHHQRPPRPTQVLVHGRDHRVGQPALVCHGPSSSLAGHGDDGCCLAHTDMTHVLAHMHAFCITCHVTHVSWSPTAFVWCLPIGQEAKPLNFRLARTDYLQRCLKPDR